VEILVLDEADRLLEMGFTEEVQELVIGVPRLVRVLCASKTCPFNCQTML
jgi:superfamily II DNA/RNA helicase